MNKGAFTIEAKGKLTAIKTPVTVMSPSGQKAEGIALWDTGANRTCVSQKFVEQLGLKHMDKASCLTAGGMVICSIYCVDILLPNDIIAENILALDIDSGNACDVLIGMDVICDGDFAVTNAEGNTWVSFCSPPLEKHIDFKSVL